MLTEGIVVRQLALVYIPDDFPVASLAPGIAATARRIVSIFRGVIGVGYVGVFVAVQFLIFDEIGVHTPRL